VNQGQGIQYKRLLIWDEEEEEEGENVPLFVRLQWTPSVDENSGEQDVVRYLIYRRGTSFGEDWGNPLVSIPAGADSYIYDDAAVELGSAYQYTYAAQDCTPSLSPLSAHTQITFY